MAKSFEAKVVGVSFTERYPENLHKLDEIINGPRDIEPLRAILRRNPDNEYDANAIEVHVPALVGWGMIGHLTRPIAARLAPEMDEGVEWAAVVESVLIDPDHPDRPGIEIRCERAPEQEQ